MLVLLGLGGAPTLAAAQAPPEPAPAEPAPAEVPVVREIEVRGATAFDRDAVLRIVHLRPGERLHRSAAQLAAQLESRYKASGYPAARVEGSFDAETATLVLAVDEGRLSEILVEGVSGETEVRARRELGLQPGAVLKEDEVDDALRRLETASRGAVAADPEEPFTVARLPEGGQLVLHLRTRRTRATLKPVAPPTAAVYNRVDGLNLGFRGSVVVTDPRSYDDLDAYGLLTYGFSAKDARFAAGIRRSFGSGLLTFGYEFHDLTDTDDAFRGSPVHGKESLTIFFSSFKDYFRRRGHEAYVFARPTGRSRIGLSWRSDDHESLPVEGDGSLLLSATPRANPAIDEGRMRSLIATARWASSGDLFDGVEAERESFLLRSLYGTPFHEEQALRADATFETASRDGLGGDFTFKRLIGQVRGRRRTGSTALAFRVLVAGTTGEPPLQKRLAMGGRGTLRGYELKEFPGDRMAVANLEWQVRPSASPIPGVVLFYDGGVTWGGSITSQGWKSGAGLGFDWALFGASLLRVDVAARLGTANGHDRVHVLARLRIPL